MASPHHRHQSSLQAVLELSSTSVLQPDQLSQATGIFNQIVSRYEPTQADVRSYKHITLLRTVYESVVSKDNFLRYFMLFIDAELHLTQHDPESDVSRAISQFANLNSWDREQLEHLQQSLATFADYLVDNFFLPLKASSRKTPQPTRGAFSLSQTPNQIIGTTQRNAYLRQQCLVRDRHRCVISRTFDFHEAETRRKSDGANARDDDEQLLMLDPQRPEDLEVTHILPRSLTSFSDNSENLQLSQSKRAALNILNMFDPGIIRLIDGTDIDRPTNALTLSHYFRQRFGEFSISFWPTPDQVLHSYEIDFVDPDWLYRDPFLPVTRTLYLTPDRTIDPPHPRLLAVHHAITRILHLSGAGDYIGQILREWKELGMTGDGSTELGRYIGLKLGGWLEEVPVC